MKISFTRQIALLIFSLLGATQAFAAEQTSPALKPFPVPTVSNEKQLPAIASIENFPFASNAQIMESLGLKDESGFEKILNDIEKQLRDSEGKAFRTQCDSLKVGVVNIFEPISLSRIACFPYFIEQAMKPEIESAEYSPGRVVSTAEQWSTLAERSFSEAFSRIRFKDIAGLQKYMGFFRETAPNCAYRNAGAGLISQAESLLPDEAVSAVIEEIYQKIAPCLRPEEDGFERTHLRSGLLRLARNDESGAVLALKSSLRTKDLREKHRALFWLGVAEQRQAQTSGKKSKENSYWKSLISEHPLEIHAILAAQTLGIDPMENWIGNKTIEARRRSTEGWNPFSAAALVTEILLHKNDANLLRLWFQFVQRTVQTRKPDELLFLGIAASKAEQHLPAIIFLTRYLRECPDAKVNLAFTRAYFPQAYAEEVLNNTAAVDPVLVFALIRQESAFNPNARSGADARGLMQLLPTTARRFAPIRPQSLYTPATNIRIGVKYLEELMRQYQGRADYVLSAYNAGPSNIRRWQIRYPIEQDLLFADLIPFKETRGYVSSILRNAYWYGRLLTIQNNQVARETIEKSVQSKWRSEVVHNLLEMAWSNSTQTSEQLKRITKIYSPTPDPSNSKGKGDKGTFVQEFPDL